MLAFDPGGLSLQNGPHLKLLDDSSSFTRFPVAQPVQPFALVD